MTDGEGLDSVGWAILGLLVAIGAVIALVLGILGLLILRVVRPKPGVRWIAACAAVWTAGFGVLTGQLMRLSVSGSITPKGEPWLPTSAAAFLIGVVGLRWIAIHSRRAG